MYLNCHSYFSLRYGTLSPQELAQEAKLRGISCLALTDINSTSAYFDFYRACTKEGIKPLIGIEFRGEDGQPLFVGIAKNQQGLYELNSFLTQHSLEEKPLPAIAPAFEHVYIIYRLAWGVPPTLRPHEWVGIAIHELPKLFTSTWKNRQDKLIALCPLTFRDNKDYKRHQLLRAIDQNTLLSKLDTTHIAHHGEHFHTEEERIFAYVSYPQLVVNAKQLADNCHIELDTVSVKNKKCYLNSKYEDFEYLKRLAQVGFEYRYPNNDFKAQERLKKELAVIYENDFICYFLITYDIIHNAQREGFHHVGRGSGANSIVAYCLRITDVDPMTLDLYFERFINKHRTSPPDFDIDFCWNERDAIFKYVFERFNNRQTGEHHVGLLATYATFQYNSLVREVGKVYGLPKGDIDYMLDEPNATDKHGLAKEVLMQSAQLVDFPNHLSIHAGGVIITDAPINNYVALQMMPKGFPIVQFDMHVAEENKFFKYDLLSQRGLGHIKDTVQLVRQNKGVNIDIHRAKDFFVDPQINKRLSEAYTIGCFYIESPAMRGLITKLECHDYHTLVAASSIIRPGVAHSGMMRQYILRYHNQDNIPYIHPAFKELLADTYGVMVYQEDVIKVAHHFGGLDLAEADILRRTMSGKHRNKEPLEEAHQKFAANCRQKGVKDEVIAEVWRQIDSFSGYSFCKAHSASYAVESYQSLYLKTYYPLEFMVGVINNFGGFYRTEVYVHEARKCGAKIEAPCVNHSTYLTTIVGDTIYLGFVHLKSLQTHYANAIIRERELHGPYRDFEDFIKRTHIEKEQLRILIRIGGLRFTNISKHHLMWHQNLYTSTSKAALANQEIFVHTDNYNLPTLEIDEVQDVYEEMELLGFPLSSPFDLLKTSFRGLTAQDMKKKIGETVRMVGYFVTNKNTRTVKGQTMCFGTWFDHLGDFFDSTHFPDVLLKYPFRGNGCYLMLGKITDEFGFQTLEVEKMAKLEWKEPS